MKDKMIQGIKDAITDLKKKDGYLFNLPTEESAEYDARKLHEVCINHCLSNHLERNLCEISNNDNGTIFFDIEFNREGGSHKEQDENGRIRVVRPDIIIHNRQSGETKINIMVIECKKKGASLQSLNEDKQKIKSFMNDHKYLYEFGLQVIYGPQNISAVFFYKNQDEIVEKMISS